MLHHIFLSYSHEDSEIKKRIRATFRQAELTMWSDADLVPGTHAWSIAIEEAIENAGCVVVLMSPAAKDSQWVNREISYALTQDIPLIPVLVGGSVSTAIPIKLIDTQYVDMRTHFERGMGQLILTIKNAISKGDVPTSPTVPTEMMRAIQRGRLPAGNWWSRPEVWMGGGAALVVVVLLVLALLGPSLAPPTTPTPATGQVVINITQPTDPSTTPRPTEAASPTSIVIVGDNPTTSMTNTPSEPPTATNTRTPTPATPVAQPVRNVVVRQGPGISYPVVATITADEQVVIQGISEDNGWYQILLPDGSVVWLIASQVETFGNMRLVPLALPPTLTPIPTQTPTNVPAATQPPTDTPVPPAATDTPVVIPTDTLQPSATPLPTDTPTEPPPSATTPPTGTPTTPPPSATPLPTDTPEPTATFTEIPSPTPTSPPAGAFPYFNTFNQGNALDGWDYDPALWMLRSESGRGMVLEGTGTGRSTLDSPAIVLAESDADWLHSDNLVIHFSFNIRADSPSAGARVVFRATDESAYNALELLPGTVILRRGGESTAFVNRDNERIVRTRAGVPVSGNTWHNVILWIENDRLDVYLDGERLLPIEQITPQLRAGQVMFQVIGNRPVDFDNLAIDHINAVSSHFEAAGLPGAWTASGAQLTTEDDGNQYLTLSGEASIATTGTWSDFEVICRLWNREGTYQIRLRDGDAGAVTLDYLVSGTLSVSSRDAGNTPVWSALPVANVHGRSNWVDLRLLFKGDTLRADINGQTVFASAIPNAPGAGRIVFATTASRDVLRLDDCLILNVEP